MNGAVAVILAAGKGTRMGSPLPKPLVPLAGRGLVLRLLDAVALAGVPRTVVVVGHGADAHLKRSVMGREVVVAVTNGQLDFGPWEQIFYGEFDGKRAKRVLVKIIGE